MNPRSIIRSAKDLTGDPKYNRLALISVAVLMAVNILLLLAEMLIDHFLQDATGLAALGKRSVLLTVQSALSLAVSLATPFWSYGFYRVAMDIARKGDPTPNTLLHGFRRFWPLVRLLIIMFLMTIGYALVGTMLGTTLYMMTPWADKAFAMAAPAIQAAEAMTSDPAALNAMMEPLVVEMLKYLWPMYLLIAIALGAFLIPWLYQLCLAPYHILDGEKSALRAMELSRHEMYGNRFAMFRLDLSWWWYYGLLALAAAPIYIYNFMGGSTLAMWSMVLLSYGLQLLIQWQWLPCVQTSYALAFDQLRYKEETED